MSLPGLRGQLQIVGSRKGQGSYGITERIVWRDGGNPRGPLGRFAFRRIFELDTSRANTKRGTACAVRPRNNKLKIKRRILP
jgi:hypothetical protein